MLSFLKEFSLRIFSYLSKNLKKILLSFDPTYSDLNREQYVKISFIELGHLDEYLLQNKPVNLRRQKMNIVISGHVVKHFGVVGLDSDGNGVSLSGPLKFSSSDVSVVILTPAPDGLSVYVQSTGKVGTSIVTATDLVTGVVGSLIVDTISGALSSLKFVESMDAPDVVVPLITPAPIDASVTTEQPVS